MNKLKHVSPSQLNQFSQCPRQWYYKKILRLKPDSVENYTHANMGSAIHSVMEMSLNAFKKGMTQYTDPHKLLPAAIKKYEVIPEFQLLLPTMVDNTINNGWFDDAEYSVQEQDQTYMIGDIKIMIKIDRLIQKNNSTKIIDLKTSKRPFSEGIEKLWQSRLYAYPMLNAGPVIVEYWFVRYKGNKVRAMIYESSKKKIESALASLVTKMRNEDGSNYNISGLCENYCPFYNTCLKNR
jgi:CRISPR/Cas system-associated exonuclease Cas4 (RecB family)